MHYTRTSFTPFNGSRVKPTLGGWNEYGNRQDNPGDGYPRSLKIAEITSRTVQAILFPRARIDAAVKRPELRNVGVYFLIGTSDEDSKPMLYVGEAEECLTRFKQQNKQKDFWSTAIAVISRTKYFTKTHVEFLESYCHEEALKAGRYKLEQTMPTRPFVSESMEADLLENYDTIKVLVATLGYPIFDQITKPKKEERTLLPRESRQS